MKSNPENSHKATSYRFNGKEYDQETGNYYYGARYYDPKLSIWLSVDPLAAEFPHLTPYNFTENNPINLIDPDGMSATCPECPDGPEFDQARNSIFDYNYNSETGEATLADVTNGGELGEATVSAESYSTTPSDNTQVNADPGNTPISDTFEPYNGTSTAERTKQADAIDKWFAKHLDMDAVQDIGNTESLSGHDKEPQWLEGITEWFDGPDYEPSGDSVIIQFVGESGPKVRSILTPGGGIGGARNTPPTAEDSLKHRIVK